MTDLTKITSAFGLLDKDTKEALKAHGGPYQIYIGGEYWRDFAFRTPVWSDGNIYRVKPLTKPSIDWSALADNMRYLMVQDDGRGFVSEFLPQVFPYGYGVNGGVIYNVTHLASYDPGTCDWRDSLVIRPGYEGKLTHRTKITSGGGAGGPGVASLIAPDMRASDG